MAHIRLALSRFRPNKGEYAENVTRIGAVITQAAQLDPKPDLVVFPETATSGYSVEGGVKELAVTAGTLARDLAAAYQGPAIDVVVGFYERFQNHIYNSALYVTLETKQKPAVRHVHRKVFLPTYGVFDEERFVDRGQDGVRSFETGWGGTAAILICEDAWHSRAARAHEEPQRAEAERESQVRSSQERDAHARRTTHNARRRRRPSGPRRRPARHRSRAHPAVVGEFFEGRGRTPARFPEGHRRPVGRGGFRAHGVPGRGGARQRERDRRAPALSHVQPRKPRARAAGHRQAGHPRAHDRHLRRCRWLLE